MAKKFIDLSNEFILDVRFNANQVKDDNSGYMVPVFTDETKTKAHGKQIVDQVICSIPMYDREGYNTNLFQKVYLQKSDILLLAEKIKEIEAVEIIGIPGDDLPF